MTYTIKRSDGKILCQSCCWGDRCDDSSHYYRPNCPVCHGKGYLNVLSQDDIEKAKGFALSMDREALIAEEKGDHMRSAHFKERKDLLHRLIDHCKRYNDEIISKES